VAERSFGEWLKAHEERIRLAIADALAEPDAFAKCVNRD
jgi:hypothetical protein